MKITVQQGIRTVQTGLIANAALAVVKLIAGIVGNAYALVADAVESFADVVSSLVVWGGLAVAAQPADEDHPFGHGKAEAIAAAVVAVMVIGAAVALGIEAMRQIRTPHRLPALWTLAVLVAVVVAKWVLAQRVRQAGDALGSTAVRADAWHHLSDAVTSAAAFIGITVAIVGYRTTGSIGWAAADDWAALLAALVIGYNGYSLLRPAIHDLMDRMADDDVVESVRAAAEAVPEVRAVEKLFVRKSGFAYRVTAHIQAEASMSLEDAHMLGHRVQDAIQATMPQVQHVLVHMEPYAPRVH
jgi:cation diffusion facilitator family transporter